MLFNSLTFALFFVVVYALYLVLRHKGQNRMLLAASCVFYGAWDWRFLFLMFVSITTDYLCGRAIARSREDAARKRYVAVGVCVNLGILGFFKYYNFFADNLCALLERVGFCGNLPVLNIILPVGISFYTFQSMSYLVDVYRREVRPVDSYWDYALFVSFFPQLVAGPIMRAKVLLPQILAPRVVTREKFADGGYLILLGLFQKVFVADNLGRFVDASFSSQAPYNGYLVLSTLYFFAFQIFCDFAGYSNIARGLGKCMGFEIMINFREPYFATNPREFWRRWHISLSTWLRDYLYIPLGGEQKREGEDLRQSFHHDAPGRSLARGPMDLCRLGGLSGGPLGGPPGGGSLAGKDPFLPQQGTLGYLVRRKGPFLFPFDLSGVVVVQGRVFCAGPVDAGSPLVQLHGPAGAFFRVSRGAPCDLRGPLDGIAGL